MTDDEKLAAGALLLLLLWRRKRSAVPGPVESPTDADRADLLELDLDPNGQADMMVESTSDNRVADWCYPLPTLVTPDERTISGVVSSGFRSVSRPNHDGLDMMWPRAPLGPVQVPGDHGSRAYFAPGPGNLPPFTRAPPVLAARAGRVWSVRRDPKGWSVKLDHGRPYATLYLHLESVELPLHTGGKRADGGAPVEVEVGQTLGVMGYSPLDAERVRHLHFQLQYMGQWVDPEKHLSISKWGRKTWRI